MKHCNLSHPSQFPYNMVHSQYAGVGWFLSDKQQETDAEIMLDPATTTLELFGELDKLFSLFLASRKEISKRFMS